MTELLIKLFIKNADNTEDKAVRGKYINLGTFVGIVCNIILAAAKTTIGLLAGSTAIVADGINNLTDTGSSVITQIGYKLSNRPSDEDHPFGHGRLEYLSAMAIGVIIILVGFQLLKSSFYKILHPEALSVEWSAILALVLSILLKFWMYLFNKKVGKKIHSTALIATAQDSINDSISTFAVLVAAAVYLFTKGAVNIDAYIGAGVSLFILYSGINTIRETMQPLLGTPPEPELVKAIEDTVLSYPEFVGVHDLIVHNYGPGRCFASLHVEVPSDIDIVACHEDIDACEKRIKQELSLEIVMHMDPVEVNNETVQAVKARIAEGIKAIDERLTLHDFRMVDGKNNINVIFDVVLPADSKMSPEELTKKVQAVCRLIDPRYTAVVTVDRDYAGR